jgi:hypothetical protein
MQYDRANSAECPCTQRGSIQLPDHLASMAIVAARVLRPQRKRFCDTEIGLALVAVRRARANWRERFPSRGRPAAQRGARRRGHRDKPHAVPSRGTYWALERMFVPQIAVAAGGKRPKSKQSSPPDG